MPRNAPKTPLYVKIYYHLRDQIRDGKYPAGTFLPSEKEICAQFSASRTTVRLALGRLDQDGLIRTVPGKGREAVMPSSDTGVVLQKPVLYLAHAGDGGMTLGEKLRTHVERTYHGTLDFRAFSSDTKLADLVNPDAISGIVYWFNTRSAKQFKALCEKYDLPAVACIVQESDGFDAVDVNNLNAMEILVDRAVEFGHKTIAFAASRGLNELHSSYRYRRIGYEAALAKHGLEANVLFCEHNNWNLPDDENGLIDFVRETGTTCVIAPSESATSQIVLALQRHGMKVPDDVSVLGYGTVFESHHSQLEALGIDMPTCVVEPWDEIAAEALDCIALRASGKQKSHQLILLNPTLVEGETLRDLR